MRSNRNITLSLIIASLFAITLPALAVRQDMNARAANAYGKLPLSFVENRGQLDKQVRYVIRGSEASAFFTNKGVTFDLTQSQTGKPKSPHDIDRASDSKPTTIKHVALRMEFRDASSKCVVTGMDKLPGKVNMFIGKDSTKWKKGIGTYKGVMYKNVWKGVDVVYRGDKRELKYDILVGSGAKVSQIKLKYSGAQKLSLDKKGDLHIKTTVASFVETVPGVHQMKSGKKTALKGAYTLIDKQTVGFKVQGADPALPLVIDPVSDLKYSTYLGGAGSESGMVIAVDDYGCAYIGCTTTSSDFPATPGAYDVTFNGDSVSQNPSRNAMLSKLNAQGTSLEYSTYLGGIYYTILNDIAVDEYGYLYFTGWAQMRDFPSTPGAISSSGKYWEYDLFIGKLGTLGDNMEYLASFGGSEIDDTPCGIAIDSEGCAYVSGYARSADFPTTPGAYQTIRNGASDCFVVKINPTGTTLNYSTFLGGSNDESYANIKVDDEGCAYICGSTKSTDFPTTSGSYNETYNGGTYDGYITKLNPSGTGLEYSTFLGGSAIDGIGDLVLDANHNVYVTGNTESLDFPTTTGVYRGTFEGSSDAFAAKLNSTGSSLIFSSFFGIGSSGAIDLDSNGYIYVSGMWGNMATPDAYAKAYYRPDGAGGYIYFPGYIAKFDPTFTTLVYATNIGGAGPFDFDMGRMVVDNQGSIYIAASGNADGLSATPGAFDTTFNGGSSDAFVAKFDIKHASVKPDMWIRPITVSTYIGMNVYEDTPNTQVCSQTVKVNKTAIYYAWIENDSKIPGYIGVKGTSLPDGWTLKYTDANGVDITSDILAGLYLTSELAPGKKQLIIISMTPLVNATGDAGVTLTASSVGTSFMKDSAKFNAVFDPAKPDIWLRPSTNNTYIGMNIYEPVPDTQVCSQASSSKTLIYYARIEDDGPISGKFTLSGSDAPSGWSVKYLDSANADITSGVIAGTYETASLAPGTNTLLTVYLKPLSNTSAGNVNIDLTATNAASPTNVDSCRFSVLSQLGKPDMWIRALPDASYGGMNVYESSPVTQTCSQSIAVNKTGIYYAWIENDGFTSAKFIIKGTTLPAGWDLKYRDAAGLDITSAVLAGTYQTAELAPGKKHQVTVYIKPLSAALGDTSITLTASTQGGTVISDSGLFAAHGL